MSQVRKFQNSGAITTQPSSGHGSFRNHGKMVISKDMDDEDFEKGLRELSSYIASRIPDYNGSLAGLTEAIRSGADIDLDDGFIKGMSGKWIGVDQKGDNKRTAGKDKAFNRALKHLSYFDYNPSKKKGTILGDTIFFTYDDSGKYLENAEQNRRIAERLTQIGRHLGNESNSDYSFSDKYTDAQKEAMRSLYTANKENWQNTFNAIIDKARGGKDKLNAEDLAFLKTFNIMEGGDEESTSSSGKMSKKDREKAKGFGFNDDLLDRLDGKVVVNDDGSLSLVDGAGWGLDDYGNGNVYFNDSFYANAANASRYSPFRGLTLFENRLYGINNARLKELLNREGGYNELYRAGRFREANDIVRTDWTPSELWEGEQLDKTQYLPGFEGNIRFKTYRNDDGDQVLEYVNLDNPIEEGSPYTNYDIQYALLDAYGNLKQDQIGKDYIKANNFYAAPLSSYLQVSTNRPNDPYRNYYYVDPTNSNGVTQGYRIYIPKDGNGDYIIEDPNEERNISIPKEIAKILFTQDRLYNIGALDAQGKKYWHDFLEAMSDPNKIKYNGFWDWGRYWSNRQWNNFARQWGLSPEETNAIGSYIDSMQPKNRGVYRPVVQSQKNGGVLKFVRGGTSGGSTEVRGVSERITNNEKTYNPKNAAGIADLFSKEGRKNWTDDDTADLVALGADLGSLVLAFTPGTNVASAAVGAAGSLARFKADLGRDTGGAGWNLALNLGMDAATLIPFLGGAVKTGKVVNAVRKSAKTLIRAASVFGLGSTFTNSVTKIASGEKWTVRDVSNVVNGLTAATALSKAGGFGKKTTKKGEFNEITIKGKTNNGVDLSGKEFKLNKENLGSDFGKLSAEQQKQKIAEVLLAQARDKSGISSLTEKQLADAIEGTIPTTFSGTEITIKGIKSPSAKLAGKEIKLTSEEVKSISEKSSADQKTALEDVIWGKVKAETGNNNISREDALGLVEMSQFSKQGRRKITPGKGWMKRQEKFDLGASQKPGEVKATGNWLHDWWYGVGPTQTIYNMRFAGEAPVAPNKRDFLRPVTRTGKRQVFNPETDWKTTSKKTYTITKKMRNEKGKLVPKKGQLTLTTEVANPRTVKYTGKGVRFDRKAYESAVEAYKNILSRYKNFSVGVPQFINTYTDANYQQNQYQTPAGFAPLYLQYKKGGVLKGNDGFNTNDEANKQSAEISAEPGLTNPYQGGDLPKHGYFNFDAAPVINGVGAGIANYFIGKQKKAWDNYLNNYQYISDYRYSPKRFQLSGAGDAYREAAKQHLLVRSRTSDPIRDAAMRQATYGNYIKAKLQGNLQDAKEFGAYQTYLDDLRLKNDELGHKIEDYRRQERNTISQQKALATQAEAAERSQVLNKLLYAGAQDAKKLYELSAYKNAYDASKDIRDLYDNAAASYNAATDKTTPEALRWKADMDKYGSQLSDIQVRSQMPGVWRVKSGGKTKSKSEISTSIKYSRDPYPEILIEDTKASHRFAEKLSVEALRMIANLKPFHVS